jgi:hypothetical protein
MFRLPRMALVLLIAAILSTTAVLAASGPGMIQPRRSVIPASAPIGLVSQLWSFLARIWSKNGSEVDPSGMQTKNGSQVDPSGSSLAPVLPATSGGNGHQVDPSG